MADRFPALLSHCKSGNHTVHDIKQTGLRPHLMGRLLLTTHEELLQVDDILTAATLSNKHDVRDTPFSCDDGKLSTSVLYKLLRSAQDTATRHARRRVSFGTTAHLQESNSLPGCSYTTRSSAKPIFSGRRSPRMIAASTARQKKRRSTSCLAVKTRLTSCWPWVLASLPTFKPAGCKMFGARRGFQQNISKPLSSFAAGDC